MNERKNIIPAFPGLKNGKTIKNLAQAKAIASHYGSEGEEKKSKKFTYKKKG